MAEERKPDDDISLSPCARSHRRHGVHEHAFCRAPPLSSAAEPCCIPTLARWVCASGAQLSESFLLPQVHVDVASVSLVRQELVRNRLLAEADG